MAPSAALLVISPSASHARTITAKVTDAIVAVCPGTECADAESLARPDGIAVSAVRVWLTAPASQADPKVFLTTARTAAEHAIASVSDDADSGTVSPTDVVVVERTVYETQKRLACFDMDSCLLRNECIDEMAREGGRKDEVAAVTERAMNGELDFADSLRQRVGACKGLLDSQMETVWQSLTLTPGARAVTRVLSDRGVTLVLCSGGFLYFARRVAARLGIDYAFANTLAFQGDGAERQLNGDVIPPIVTGQVKQEMARAVAAKLGLDRSAMVAIGDGSNDRYMLGEAGVGVSFNGKAILRAATDYHLDNTDDLGAFAYVTGIVRDVATTANDGAGSGEEGEEQPLHALPVVDESKPSPTTTVEMQALLARTAHEAGEGSVVDHAGDDLHMRVTGADDLALDGADIVRLRDDEQHIMGSADISEKWGGCTFRFVSEASRATFRAAPRLYAESIACGGWDAWSVLKGRWKMDADPSNFLVHQTTNARGNAQRHVLLFGHQRGFLSSTNHRTEWLKQAQGDADALFNRLQQLWFEHTHDTHPL